MRCQGGHGFRTIQEWKNFFEEYQKIGASVSQDNVPVPRNNAPPEFWVEAYRRRSKNIRKIYGQMETVLDWHIRYFTQTPEHWDEETASSLLSYLFRNCIQIDDSEICMGVKALALYESTFDRLNEEESSMGISIYDYVTDQLIEMACRREEDGRTLYTEYLSVYKKSMEMIDRVIASVDLTEKLHSTLPNIRILLQSRPATMVIRRPSEEFTEDQLRFLNKAAKKVYEEVADGQTNEFGIMAVNEITYLMTERLLGRENDERIRSLIMELESMFSDPRRGGTQQCDSMLLDADQIIILSLSQMSEKNPAMVSD